MISPNSKPASVPVTLDQLEGEPMVVKILKDSADDVRA